MKTTNLILAIVAMTAYGPLTAHADPRPADILGNTCAGCHGTYGASKGETMPTVGGLNKAYLHKVMTEFANESRPSTIMGRIARGYSDHELQAISAYLADKPWVNASAKTNSALTIQGKNIAKSQCNACHGEGGTTNLGDIPRLAGQWPAYLYNQMVNFNEEGNSAPQPQVMREMMQKLSDQDLHALAHYYASQK